MPVIIEKKISDLTLEIIDKDMAQEYSERWFKQIN